MAYRVAFFLLLLLSFWFLFGGSGSCLGISLVIAGFSSSWFLLTVLTWLDCFFLTFLRTELKSLTNSANMVLVSCFLVKVALIFRPMATNTLTIQVRR